MKKRIYLLPGTMCDKRLWKNITPLLNEYELIHLDIPLKNSLDEICEELLKKIEEKKANLLGFSLGAYIAAYFACKFPNRISKLMLLANTACDLPELEIKKREGIINHIKSFGLKGLSRKKAQALLGDENQNKEELILLIQDMYASLGKEVLISQLKSTLKREDLLEFLLTLSFPIMFCYSKEDFYVDQTWMQKLKERESKIEIVEYEGSSHMLTLEKPQEITKLIKEFVL